MRNIGIAIIDDESLVRLGIKSSVAWEEYGYEIVGEADNGQTGLEMIREKHPDIVLLDVCMPVMNGIEVLKSLQKLKIQCKVIILSCHDDFCFVKEAIKNGAFDYLRKNEINSANILTVLEEVRHSLCKKQDEGQGGWDSYARHVCLHRLITGSSEPAERPVACQSIAHPGRKPLLHCVCSAELPESTGPLRRGTPLPTGTKRYQPHSGSAAPVDAGTGSFSSAGKPVCYPAEQSEQCQQHPVGGESLQPGPRTPHRVPELSEC